MTTDTDSGQHRVLNTVLALLIVSSTVVGVVQFSAIGVEATSGPPYSDDFESGDYSNTHWSGSSPANTGVEGSYSASSYTSNPQTVTFGAATLDTRDSEISGTMKMSGAGSLVIADSNSSNTVGVEGNYVDGSYRTTLAKDNGTRTISENYTASGSWVDFRVRFDDGEMKYKQWAVGGSEPDSWNLTMDISESELNYSGTLKLTSSGTDQGAYLDDVTVHTSSQASTSGNSVSGTVETQGGAPVGDAHVRVWAVNESALNVSDPNELDDRANELLDDLQNPKPEQWTSLPSDFGVKDRFTSQSGKGVLIHSEGAWHSPNAGQYEVGAGLSTELSRPIYRLNPGDAYEFSVWDAGSDPLIEDSYDRQLPGVSTSGTVVIKKLSPTGETVSEHSFETKPQYNSFGYDKEHETAEISLTRGFYVVTTEDGSMSYPVVVGSPASIAQAYYQDLKDKQGDLTQRASEIRDRLDAGELGTFHTTTDADGDYNISLPSQYQTVAVTAYKANGELLDDVQNPSLADLRDRVSATGYNGSVYLPAQPDRVSVPTSDADLTMRKLSSPTMSNLDSWLDKWTWLQDTTATEDFASSSVVFGDLYNASQTELWERANQLNNATGGTTEIPNEGASKAQLQQAVRTLTTKLNNQSTTIETLQEETETAVDSGNLSLTMPFGSDLAEDELGVMMTYANGSTTTIPQEYWTVESNGMTPIGGDSVVISDYPLPANGTIANVEIVGQGEDGGLARGSEQVKMPGFDGETPDIGSVHLSSARPGVDETVTMSVSPDADDEAFSGVKDATVYAPSGQQLNTTVSGGQVEWTPSGQGSHLVRLTVSGTNGHEYVVSQRVEAGENPVEFPASMRLRSGVLGTHALVSGGVETADVDIKSGGSQVAVTGQLAEDATPTELRVYTREVVAGTSPTYDVTLTDANGDRVEQSIPVVLKGPNVGGEAHVRVHDEPVTMEGTEWGDVSRNQSTMTIKTYLQDGSASISTNSAPSTWEDILWVVETNTPDLPSTDDIPLTLPPTPALNQGVAA